MESVKKYLEESKKISERLKKLPKSEKIKINLILGSKFLMGFLILELFLGIIMYTSTVTLINTPYYKYLTPMFFCGLAAIMYIGWILIAMTKIISPHKYGELIDKAEKKHEFNL